MELRSTITCPECGSQFTETMATDSCRWFYQCAACHTVITPREGDCCVFCSYADVKCPPIQAGKNCCA
jgi:hypothetical protein